MSIKFYWDLTDLPEFVRKELFRRTAGIKGDFTYKPNEKGDYIHPASTFARVCSNAMIRGKEGFILNGLSTAGFDDSYGFNAESATILGYDCNGEKHFIPGEKYKHRPCPGVTEIDTELSGGEGKFRISTIKWRCWSKEQLDYMTPYFLTVGITVSIEFGWNIIEKDSLLPISNASELTTYFTNEDGDGDKNILKLVERSSGNYDAALGLISEFDYTARADGGFDCVTVIKNVGGIFSGVFKQRNDEGNTDPESGEDEMQTSIKNYFNRLPQFARRRHMGNRPIDVSGVRRRTRRSRRRGTQTVNDNDKTEQVFYPRDLNYRARIATRGRPSSFDFDNAKDSWWLSFGYLIDFLNFYCSTRLGASEDMFTIDVESSVISAHPNMISNDGNVLLIPNSSAPQILYRDGSTQDNLRGGDPILNDANEILRNQRTKFITKETPTGEGIYITRTDLNSIINWWAEDRSNMCFPSDTEDDTVKRAKYYGYLKNLYVNKNVVIEAIDNHHTFKDIILYILDKMNRAAGEIWDFAIVPYTSSGHDNGTMTIIDKSSTNNFNPNGIFDFKLNQIKSVVRSATFSVKSSDAVAMQTLFGRGIDSTSQEAGSPIDYPQIRDRLMINKDSGSNAPPAQSRSISMNRRIPSKEHSSFYFYTKNDGITYCLVEPYRSIQTELLNTKKDNPLRYSAVQPNTTLELGMTGISGIVNLNTFTVSELPFPYGERCYFQVQNVRHSVSNGSWLTVLTAGVRLKPEHYGK
jgi:hypothetical protein